MRMKQTMFASAVLLLGLSGATHAASERDGKPAERGGQHMTTESGTQIIIRSEAEKKRRDEENRNRQSAPGATRGLERAEERRAEQADIHSQAGKPAGEDDDRPWYDPFGLLPGNQNTDDGKNRWWWPFD